MERVVIFGAWYTLTIVGFVGEYQQVVLVYSWNIVLSVNRMHH